MDEKRAFLGVWMPAALWNNTELSWMEKCLVAEIDSLSSAEYGPCRASCEFLATRMGSRSPGAMRKMLSQLMRKGVILQLGSDGRRTWRCVAPAFASEQGRYQVWAQDSRYELGCEPGVTHGVTGRSHRVLPGGNTEIPILDTILDQSSANAVGGVLAHAKKTKTKSFTLQDALQMPTDLALSANPKFAQEWEKWLHHRFALKKSGPPTLQAVEEHLRKCKVLGPEKAIEAIRASIAANWSSIYPPHPNKAVPAGPKRDALGFIERDE
jgi:hypothetical protein